MAEQLISTSVHHTLPHSYVRNEAERPRLDEVVPDATIPVVDLSDPDRAAVVAQIGAACRSHGFFQVLNHGLPVELIQAAMAVAHDFFRLSPEEKAKLYSDDPAKKIRLSTSFNVRKETVHNWRDYLRLHCHPLEQFVPEWPANPPPFRKVMSEYCKEVQHLGVRLYPAIYESLGLEDDYMKVLGEQEQHLVVNFYPKCPSPVLTYGLPAHTDPNALTILLMDDQVAGLQVLKEGKWMAVNPRPNALVINLGDQLQSDAGLYAYGHASTTMPRSGAGPSNNERAEGSTTYASVEAQLMNMRMNDNNDDNQQVIYVNDETQVPDHLRADLYEQDMARLQQGPMFLSLLPVHPQEAPAAVMQEPPVQNWGDRAQRYVAAMAAAFMAACGGTSGHHDMLRRGDK